MTESWYPGNYRPHAAYPPHYSTMPGYLRIVDAGAPELTGYDRRFWERARDAGLAQWGLVGLDLRLKRFGAYKANRVTLSFMDMQADYGSDRPGLHCFEACPPCQPGVVGCDWVRIDRATFRDYVATRIPAHVSYLIAHEFGHSLGFGHGGTGIMDETPEHAHVNAEEIAAAQAYWGVT